MQALDQERRAKHHCNNENPAVVPLKTKNQKNACPMLRWGVKPTALWRDESRQPVILGAKERCMWEGITVYRNP